MLVNEEKSLLCTGAVTALRAWYAGLSARADIADFAKC